MRIALVTTSWPAHEEDPAGHFVRTEARLFEAAGHEVLVFAPKAGGAFGWPGVSARIWARPLRMLEAARWVQLTRRAVAREKVDRIVAHWALPCAFPIGLGAGVPLELVSHGGDVRLLLRLPARLRRAIVRRICVRASEWRFVSASLLDELLASLTQSDALEVRAIARVSPCAITLPDVRDAALLRRSVHAGRHVTVCVARLVPKKRVDAVIDHVAGAARETLLVVVGDGPERARLEAHARARCVEALFVGQTGRTEALTWIASADVLMHASRAEGFSTVVREATLLGVPVERV